MLSLFIDFEDKHCYKPERIRTCDKTQQNAIFMLGYLETFVYLFIYVSFPTCSRP
jgi:hypothetical protein